MCNKRGAFVDEKNFSVIKMHGTTIKKNCHLYLHPDPFEIQSINTIIRDLSDVSLKNLGYLPSNFKKISK
jgi:hypothetical protein